MSTTNSIHEGCGIYKDLKHHCAINTENDNVLKGAYDECERAIGNECPFLKEANK